MNEEFEKFIAWHYPDIGEGAKIEFERCWDAGAAAGYANGVAVMREKCAEVAESTTFEVEIHELMEMTKKDMGDRACHEVAAAIRKIEVG